MDLGLGSVIDKFEHHFGPRWTKALLIVVGAGATAACVGAIWQWVVAPMLAFFKASPSAISIFGLLAVFLAATTGIQAAISHVLMRKVTKNLAQSRNELEESKRLVRDAKALTAKMTIDTDGLRALESELRHEIARLKEGDTA